MAESDIKMLAADLRQILEEDLICSVARPQRWLPPGSPPGIVLFVWDAALPQCQAKLQNYLAARPTLKTPLDLTGYTQFEQNLRSGIPAFLFTVLESQVLDDPRLLFPRLRGLVNPAAQVQSPVELVRYLDEKGAAHLNNIPMQLYRLFAEIYLAAEAALQARWLRFHPEPTYAQVNRLAVWVGLCNETRLVDQDPDLYDLVQAVIESAAKLMAGETNLSYGEDLHRAVDLLRERFSNGR